MNLIEYLLPPKILRYDQLIVISPDSAALRSLSETFGMNDAISLQMSYEFVINKKRIFLDKNEVAFAMLQRRWWTRTPAVTVSILRNVR